MNELDEKTDEGVNERFNAALNFLNIRQVDLANELGTSATRIHSYVSGRSEPVTSFFIRVLHKYPKVNWFYVFEGEKYGTLETFSPTIDIISQNFSKDIISENANLKSQLDFFLNENQHLKDKITLLDKLNNLLEAKNNSPS
jgi:hypothetical protein